MSCQWRIYTLKVGCHLCYVKPLHHVFEWYYSFAIQRKFSRSCTLRWALTSLSWDRSQFWKLFYATIFFCSPSFYKFQKGVLFFPNKGCKMRISCYTFVDLSVCICEKCPAYILPFAIVCFYAFLVMVTLLKIFYRICEYSLFYCYASRFLM